MSGVDPHASFGQGPGSWNPNPTDTELGREFAQGIYSAHRADHSVELGAVLSFLGGFIAASVHTMVRGGGQR